MPRAQNRAGKGSILLWRRFTFPIFLLVIYGVGLWLLPQFVAHAQLWWLQWLQMFIDRLLPVVDWVCVDIVFSSVSTASMRAARFTLWVSRRHIVLLFPLHTVQCTVLGKERFYGSFRLCYVFRMRRDEAFFIKYKSEEKYNINNGAKRFLRILTLCTL